MENIRAYPLNQFAPIYQAGVQQPLPGEVGYEDKYFEYAFEPPNDGIIAPNVLLERQTLEIDQDADFYITGWYFTLLQSECMIHLVDSFGYELTDGFVLSQLISPASAFPSVLSPAHPLPKGSALFITIQNFAIENYVQLVFTGYKRFRRIMGEPSDGV